MTGSKPTPFHWVILICLLVPLAAGCLKNSSSVGMPVAAPNTPADEKPKPVGSATYPVPVGTADELMKFMDQIVLEPTVGETQDEQTQDLVDRMVSRAAAAEQILEGEEVESYGAFAARLKLESLRVLANIGHEGGKRKFADYAQELAENDDESYARTGRFGLFQSQVDALTQVADPNGKEVLAGIKKLLTDETRDRDLFEVTREAAGYLAVAGLAADSSKASAEVAKAFADHDDAEIADLAATLASQGQLAELNEVLAEFMSSAEPDSDKLAATVESVLGNKPSMAALGSIMNTSQQVENSGFPDLGARLYKLLDSAVSKAQPLTPEETEFKEVLAGGLKRASTRMGLVGKSVEISGLLIDGEPFDWKKYKGKFVLVDFWATWCDPCVEEMVNIKESYDRYHEKGLEVVGVNLDEDIDAVKEFLNEKRLVWPTVVGKADERGMGANVNAVKYGIETIPFIMLVGDDGKVRAIHARGHRLSRALSDALGPPSDEIVLDLDLGDDEDEEEGESASETAAEETGKADDNPEASADSNEVAPNENAADDAAGESPPKDASATRMAPSFLMSSGLTIELLVNASALTMALDPQEPADDDKNTEEKNAKDDSTETPTKNLTDEETSRNPYAPEREMTTKQLVNFLLDMRDKTRSIQFRDGFRDGIVLAADRILADDAAKTRFREIAAEAKLDYLHRDACLGDEKADKQLMTAATNLAKEGSKKIARRVVFHEHEQLAITASEKKGFDNKAYDKLIEYLKAEQERDKKALTNRHLRMASSMVEMLNLKPAKEREDGFKQLSEILVASSDKQLKRYGRRIGPPKEAIAAAEFIGKPVEMAGTTIEGEEFVEGMVKGNVVLVDFWATWCGPCRAAMPELQRIYEKYQPQGLEVVGISLDQDMDALRTYLNDNNLPWIHLAGEGTSKIADRYGVRGIPAMLLIDREGKILAKGHPSDKAFKAKLLEQFK